MSIESAHSIVTKIGLGVATAPAHSLKLAIGQALHVDRNECLATINGARCSWLVVSCCN